MDQQGRIYFKHLYAMNSHEWGVIGLPRSQTPTSALRDYQSGCPVLLAITKKPKVLDPKLCAGYKGKIFAVCTLLNNCEFSHDLANPKLAKRYPDLLNNWPWVIPIKRLWKFDQPKTYDEFAGGELTRVAQSLRGRLIDLSRCPKIEEEVRMWLSNASKQKRSVYTSEQAQNFKKRRNGE